MRITGVNHNNKNVLVLIICHTHTHTEMELLRRYLKMIGLAVLAVVVVFICVGVLAHVYETSGLGEFIRVKTGKRQVRGRRGSRSLDDHFFATSDRVPEKDAPAFAVLPENVQQQESSSRRSTSLDASAPPRQQRNATTTTNLNHRSVRSRSDLRAETLVTRARTLSDTASSSSPYSPTTAEKRSSANIPRHNNSVVKSTKEILADFQRSLEDSSIPPLTFATVAAEYTSDEDDNDEEGHDKKQEIPPIVSPLRSNAHANSSNKRVLFFSTFILPIFIGGGTYLVKDELEFRDRYTEQQQTQALAFCLVSFGVVLFSYFVLLPRLVPPPPSLPPSPACLPCSPASSSLSCPPPTATVPKVQDSVDYFVDKLEQCNVCVAKGDPHGIELPSLRLVHSAIELSAVFCILVTSDDFARFAVYDELSWAIAKRPDATMIVVIVASEDDDGGNDQSALLRTPAEYQAILTSISAQIVWTRGTEHSEQRVCTYIKHLAQQAHDTHRNTYVWDVYVSHFHLHASSNKPVFPLSIPETTVTTVLDSLALLISKADNPQAISSLQHLVIWQRDTQGLSLAQASTLLAVLRAKI